MRKAREEERIEEERKRDEERRKKREEEEERARVLAEERAREEEEEYKKWESLISVESEGEDVKTSLLDDESRLSALLSALERRKVCVLDELSCELGVSNEVRVLEWCEL